MRPTEKSPRVFFLINEVLKCYRNFRTLLKICFKSFTWASAWTPNGIDFPLMVLTNIWNPCMNFMLFMLSLAPMEGEFRGIFWKSSIFQVDLHILRRCDSIRKRKYHIFAHTSLKIQREAVRPSNTQPKAWNKKGKAFCSTKTPKITQIWLVLVAGFLCRKDWLPSSPPTRTKLRKWWLEGGRSYNHAKLKPSW